MAGKTHVANDCSFDRNCYCKLPIGALRETTMFLKRIAYALTGLILSGLIAAAATIPNLPSTSQYSEPSQIVGTINALIQQLNGQTGYATATPIVGLGSFCTNTPGGASPQICNGGRGAVLFTGI